MIDQSLIARINYLAHESQVRELTVDEKNEQDRLRKEYIRQFKEGFKQQLESIEIVDDKYKKEV